MLKAHKLFSLLIFFIVLLYTAPAKAQTEVPSYETASGSVPGTNTGPFQSIPHNLILNTNNPNGGDFTSTGVQVTFSITDAGIGVTQASNGDGDDTDGDDPATVFGWEFTNGGGAIRNGAPETVMILLNDFFSVPSNNNFTSLNSVSYLSSSPDGDGINTLDNYGVRISESFELLRGLSLDTRHDLGTLTVTFTSPVDDPVLHFNGLGARWSVTNGGSRNRYYNTATTDLDIESISGSSSGTPVVLSGTSNFEVDTGSSPNIIRNNSANPDVDNDNNGSTEGLTFAVAHGSVLFPGEDITQIVFTLRARFMETRNNLDTGAGGSGLNYDQTVFGSEGLGWAGGGQDPQTLENIPEINFSSDTWGISASVPAPNEVALTGSECFRMLSSPVQSTTYATLLDPIWTQGMTGADYTGGDPNVWLWPNNIDDANTNASGWTAPSNLGNTIPAGSGLLVSVFDDDNFDGTGDGFPKALTVEGGENAPLTFTSMNSTSDGWTLLGNPFKSTIDFDNLFNETNTSNITDAVYVYDRSTSSYISWSEGTQSGDLTGGLIAPFQGFFVQNTAVGSQVDFTEGVKSSTAGTFVGKEQELQNFSRFEVNGEGLYNSMWLRFSKNGAIEKTYGDALELHPLTTEYAMLGTRKADGTIFDIGHYPIPDEEFEIPVSFETTRNGFYTITATDMDLSIGADLYFIDLETEESIRIDENFRYEFRTDGVAQEKRKGLRKCTVGAPQKAKTVASSDRFVIATSPKEFKSEMPEAVALDQNYPNPFNPTTQISYELPQQTDVRLEVFDLVGRQVATLVDERLSAGSYSVNFDASNLSSGVYLYKLQAGTTVLTKKLTLIK